MDVITLAMSKPKQIHIEEYGSDNCSIFLAIFNSDLTNGISTTDLSGGNISAFWEEVSKAKQREYTVSSLPCTIKEVMVMYEDAERTQVNQLSFSLLFRLNGAVQNFLVLLTRGEDKTAMQVTVKVV